MFRPSIRAETDSSNRLVVVRWFCSPTGDTVVNMTAGSKARLTTAEKMFWRIFHSTEICFSIAAVILFEGPTRKNLLQV
jgi:hypothetical protein